MLKPNRPTVIKTPISLFSGYFHLNYFLNDALWYLIGLGHHFRWIVIVSGADSRLRRAGHDGTSQGDCCLVD